MGTVGDAVSGCDEEALGRAARDRGAALYVMDENPWLLGAMVDAAASRKTNGGRYRQDDLRRFLRGHTGADGRELPASNNLIAVFLREMVRADPGLLGTVELRASRFDAFYPELRRKGGGFR